MMKAWKTTGLDTAIAEEFFGFKWMSWVGRPIRGTKGYPTEMRIQQFMSPEQLSDKRWQEYLSNRELAEANGDEPLSYSYCSSCPNMAWVHHFSGDMSAIGILEREIKKRGLWDKYRGQLWCQITEGGQPEDGINESRLADADCESRCIAALAVVESKHVMMEDSER